MLVVIPIHAGDIAQAKTLLEWILKLGENKSHDCLIVVDAGTPFDKAIEIRELASAIFREVRLISNEVPTNGWPAGPYSLFRAATKFIAESWPQPFLILEPDAIPLRRDWLDRIAIEYDAYRSHTPFMGHIYEGEGQYAGKKFMSGVAVYPADTETRLIRRDYPVHWDVDGAEVMVSQGVHTSLIKHLFGEIGLAPTFAEKRVPGTNVFDLGYLGDAAIFHRNKDGSLIRLLRKKFFNERSRKNIVVVFPVCERDINLGLKHAMWLQRLGQRWPHEALVAFDFATPVPAVNHLRGLLENCFERVTTFSYHTPPIPGWPMAANWMFQNIAHHMAKQDRSWMLVEPDAVVLRAGWLADIQDMYENCGKSFMGPHVKGMQHVNGGAIYPPDTPSRIPIAMKAVELAWDYVMPQDRMMADCHDASELMTHLWTVIGDEPSEVGGGEVPVNCTPERAKKWLRPGAAIIHRIKDSSLIDLLISGRVCPP